MSVIMVKATPVDIPLLVKMMQVFYAESDYPLDEQWAAESFATLLRNNSYGSAWLAYTNGKAAGYIVVTVRFSMEYGGLEACIDDLFVRPPYRRQGLAQALVDEVIRECKSRGVSALHVEVGTDNLAAKKLYQNNGLQLRDDDRQLLIMQLKEN